MTVVLMALISAPQASLLLTEEQRDTLMQSNTFIHRHNRLPHAHPSLTTRNIIHLTPFTPVNIHKEAIICYLAGLMGRWLLNNNKCVSGSGF